MICTKRDTDLLESLGRFGVLSTEQIAKIFFKNIAITTVRRRLRALEKADLIYRIDGLDCGAAAWVLTKNTAKKLGIMYPIRHFNRNSVKHDVTLSEVRNVLEGKGIAENWVPEHVLKIQTLSKDRFKKDEDLFVPDAVFSMAQRVVALELELNGKHRKRYETILTRYKRRKTIGCVWYLVPNESLGQKLENVWGVVNDGKRNDLLRWSLLSELMQDPHGVRLRNEHSSHALSELITPKVPALSGAPPESGQTQTMNVV